MYSAVYVVGPPAAEPVTVAMARQHLRVDHTDEDTLIAAFITAARTWAEQYLGRSLVSQQLNWTMAHRQPPNGYPYLSLPLSLLVMPMWFSWPLASAGSIELPRRPIISVDQVSYGQWGKADTVLEPSTDYDVDIASARLQIHPYSQVLPNDHLNVLFTSGYPDVATIPGTIPIAILMLTAFLYENRGDAGGEMPTAAEMLLTPFRMVGFG